MKAKYILAVLLLTGLFLNGCVKDKIFEGPPVLSNLVLTPQAPTPADAVTVAIKVTDMNGVKTVTLNYKVETGSYVSVPMTLSGENVYSGGIPKQEGGVTVTYYIEAENTVGKKGYHPTGAPETTAAYTVGAPSIVINEVYSRGVPADPDWIEIYNNSDVVVDISGYKIYDAGGQSGAKPKKEIPAGTVMQARAFFAMSTEGSGEPSDFGLSSGGEEVWLESPKGTIVDNIAFTAMDVNQSFGRMPDGSQNLQLLQTITRGAPNDNTPPAAVIKINEIYSRGIPDAPDWIELYNASTFAADVSGYKIYDGGGNSGSKPKKEIPAGTTIPAGGFFVMVVDDAADSGFGLSSGGEEVWLENATGTVIDNAVFPALAETESYGRFPDGTDNWQILFSITKGAANSNAPPSAIILMNEVYSRGIPDAPDWIELYNASAFSADISGYKLYDSGGKSGSKAKKEIPAGTTIPAGGFYVMVVDDGTASGFGLSSGGETAWFENASGTILDSIAFPSMAETESFGRLPDGSANWQLLAKITKGSPNSNESPAVAERVHYWHFNNLAEGTLADGIAANYSATGAGAASISYPGTGAGYMDRVDPGSTINAFAGDTAGFGLRPRNPANTRELILETPSTGFEKLTVKFASMRSSSGATQEELYYSANGGTDWVKVGSAYDIPLDWELKSFDLSGIAAVNNNKDLKIKILFVGTGADGASGNNRFDNITIEGTKVN